jgi:hypothetical protein
VIGTATDDLLTVTIPSVAASLIAGGCAVWAAKVGRENRRALHEVKRKVTTPGKGTLGQKVQAVAEMPATDANGTPIVEAARRVEEGDDVRVSDRAPLPAKRIRYG